MIRLFSMLLPAILLLTGFLVTPAFGLIYVSNIRHWAAPDYTRIVIDTSDEATYVVSKEGRRITLTVKNADVAEDVPLQSFLNKPGVEKIEVVTLPDESVRIELTLTQDVEAKVFKLKKFLEKPNRIVIDLQFPEVEEKESLSRQEVKKLQKARIVVIDAGHGGEDPGAVGKMGTREKDVVLKIAKKLHDNLNKREGYRAFLTRTGDYYVPFKKRTQDRPGLRRRRLRQHPCRRRPQPRQSGADRSTSSPRAARQTRRQGCWPARRTSPMSWAAGPTTTPHRRIRHHHPRHGDDQHRQPLPRACATFAAQHLRHQLPEIHPGPGGALPRPQDAEIPSVLIETAYISNPTEEKLLRTPAFQDEMAGAIAKAIVKFVPSGQPPVTVQVAGAKDKTGSAAAKKEERAEKPRQREGRAIEKAREDDAGRRPSRLPGRPLRRPNRPRSASPPRPTRHGQRKTARSPIG